MTTGLSQWVSRSAQRITRILDPRRPMARRGGENRVCGPSGKPLLVIVRGTDIDAMVDAGLEAIGGLGRFIAGQGDVVLKPNSNQRDAFPSITAPETLRAVARHCQAAGAARVVVHEDHKYEPDYYYDPREMPGIEIARSYARRRHDYLLVEHQGWHGDGAMPSDLSGVNPLFVDALRWHVPDRGPRLRVARPLQEAAVVINLPVVKRHRVGQISSALKNHFGSVYGPHRWLAHAVVETDRPYFDRKLVEFADAVRPELTITDARSIQAVFGPRRSDDTIIVNGVNHLIVTGDMVAADVVATALMREYDPTFGPANEAILRCQHEYAEEIGLGSSDLSAFERIEVDA